MCIITQVSKNNFHWRNSLNRNLLFENSFPCARIVFTIKSSRGNFHLKFTSIKLKQDFFVIYLIIRNLIDLHLVENLKVYPVEIIFSCFFLPPSSLSSWLLSGALAIEKKNVTMIANSLCKLSGAKESRGLPWEECVGSMKLISKSIVGVAYKRLMRSLLLLVRDTHEVLASYVHVPPASWRTSQFGKVNLHLLRY